MVKVRAEQEQRRRDHQPELRADQDLAAVETVDLRAEPDRHEDHRNELHEADGTDGNRRVREVVDLDEERNQCDLAANLREHLAGPEQPKIS